MYTLVIYLYMCAVGIAAIFNKRARKLAVGHRKAFFQLKHQVQKDARYLWFHAASLGEFEQGRPLMERLRREHPEYKILLTFFSPSGYEVRKDWEGADVICYLPLDTPAHVRLFFHFVKPEALFLIKYEFWQNYLKGCQRLHIPVYSVSSIFRPGQIFFRWYGRGYARVLTRVTHFFVQNQQSVDLLASLGISGNVTVAGDTRFDRVLDIRASARPLPLVEKFAAGHVVFVAGSVGQDSLRAPREAIVLAQPVVQVDSPIANVTAAIAVVGNGNQCSVAARGDGRNAIGHPSFNRLKQPLGASGLCMAAHRSKCQKQDGQ